MSGEIIGGIIAAAVGLAARISYEWYTSRMNRFVPPPDDDADTVRHLRARMAKAGLKEDALVRAVHYVGYETEAKALTAMREISARGYETQGGEFNTSDKYRFIVLAKRTLTPDGVPDDIKRVTALAKRSGGDYQLWQPEL